MAEYPFPNPEDEVPYGVGNTDDSLPSPGGETQDTFPAEDTEKFVSPQLSDHISRDEDAYGFHGMTEPGEKEQPFDLSVLDDPELDGPEPEPTEPQGELPENIPADFLAEAESDLHRQEQAPSDDYQELDDEEFRNLLNAEPEPEPHPLWREWQERWIS